jgi:hypothetical protein
LTLEGVDDIHGGDGLAASVLGVGHGIADDVLKEHLEDSSGLLVDEAGDALDTSSACETADGRLGDALDVVTKDLAVTLGASLSESLSSFSATRHSRLFRFFDAHQSSTTDIYTYFKTQTPKGAQQHNPFKSHNLVKIKHKVRAQNARFSKIDNQGKHQLLLLSSS